MKKKKKEERERDFRIDKVVDALKNDLHLHRGAITMVHSLHLFIMHIL